MTDLNYENLGLGFHFSSSWKSGCASIPTSLCLTDFKVIALEEAGVCVHVFAHMYVCQRD